MLTLQSVTYIHPNGDLLFSDLDLIVNNHDKIALVGNNGAGKSSLLKILSGNLKPSSGVVKAGAKSYYLPQVVGQFNQLTVAQALQIDDQLTALREILNGNINETNLTMLNNDWAIEERCKEAFSHWKIDGIDLRASMGTLSGGQKTKLFLAGIMIHQPEIVLLDEPSNHLDVNSRNVLYDYVTTTRNTLVVVSHDRTLLNQLHAVYELSRRGITVYGGNYEFYAGQKTIEQNALHAELKNKEKALRKAKEIERESVERQQKLNSRGKKKQEKAGLPTIMMNTLKNNAEKSIARVKNVHAEKVKGIVQELGELRKEVPDTAKMKVDLKNSPLHNGKTLIEASQINFCYDNEPLWTQNMNFKIKSGERIAIKGSNGTGKTTLIQLMLGQLQPTTGTIDRAPAKAIYIDQNYSLIDNRLTVYDQAQHYNSGALQEHDIKLRLNRFLFSKQHWDKHCDSLSGGEKMRLMLCSLTITTQTPDIIVLDEPTNNLDLQNIEILTAAINEYKGTLIVVSHDEYFLRQIDVPCAIILSDSV